MYKTKSVKPKTIDFDLIVIGTGAGGGTAAHIAARRGKRVAVVEQEVIGGECPNFGCVPTKALLQVAETYETIKKADEFGIKIKDHTVDFKAIHTWKNQAVKNTGTGSGELLFKREGITLIRGHAHFLDKWTLSVGSKRYTSENFLIATGTHDIMPPIEGLKKTGYVGYRKALDMKPPKRLFVVGGGAIGCEFTHYFATFGTQVYIADIAPRLLAKEDSEMGDLLQSLFEQKGVKVLNETKVMKVEKKGKEKIVTYEHNGKIQKVTVDEIMLAAGKAPNVDIGLENAGVHYTKKGVMVNLHMQTSTPHIYAAGDVTGKFMFTHVASYQSRIAVQNMFSPLKHVASYKAVPRCVFVSPECAAVGATEDELKDKNIRYQSASIPISILGRSNVTKESTGYVKILANKKGVVLGASIVAPRAGEMIHELALAIQWKLKASKIDYTIHAYPTWSQAVRVCASKIVCR